MAFVSATPLNRIRGSGSVTRELKSQGTWSNTCSLTMALNVLVSGSTGRTGRLVCNFLAKDDRFNVSGFARDEKKAKEILGEGTQVFTGDVLDTDSLRTALNGKDALVVLTSAQPMMVPQPEGNPPKFSYEVKPEQVDWEGGKNQVDLAKELGVKHVVFVGSMGSTNEDHPLNKMGDNGNILVFKRKAEQYLIDSGVTYTVVNPGGLIDEPHSQRQIVFGKADKLFGTQDKSKWAIPRGDVARVVVAALGCDAARNKALDCMSMLPGEAPATTDFEPLFQSATPGL